jgi:hypothetical protein
MESGGHNMGQMNFITDFLLIRQCESPIDPSAVDVTSGFARDETIAWADSPTLNDLSIGVLYKRLKELRQDGNTVFFIGIRWMDILPYDNRPVFLMACASKIRFDDETTVLFSDYLKKRRYHFETDQNGIVTSIEGRSPAQYEP